MNKQLHAYTHTQTHTHIHTHTQTDTQTDTHSPSWVKHPSLVNQQTLECIFLDVGQQYPEEEGLEQKNRDSEVGLVITNPAAGKRAVKSLHPRLRGNSGGNR